MGARANVFCALARQHRTAGKVVRILKRDQTGRRDVIGGVGMQRARNFIPSQNPAAVVALHRPRQHARECGHRRHFKVEDVAALFNDNLLAGSRVQFDCRLISHRTGRHKKRCFLLKDFSRALLQTIDRRIFAVNVVTDFGFGHCSPHRGRWFSDSVAA